MTTALSAETVGIFIFRQGSSLKPEVVCWTPAMKTWGQEIMRSLWEAPRTAPSPVRRVRTQSLMMQALQMISTYDTVLLEYERTWTRNTDSTDVLSRNTRWWWWLQLLYQATDLPTPASALTVPMTLLTPFFTSPAPLFFHLFLFKLFHSFCTVMQSVIKGRAILLSAPRGFALALQ
jgi:hypothetical protein